jgi:hypothetical protein
MGDLIIAAMARMILANDRIPDLTPVKQAAASVWMCWSATPGNVF